MSCFTSAIARSPTKIQDASIPSSSTKKYKYQKCSIILGDPENGQIPSKAAHHQYPLLPGQAAPPLSHLTHKLLTIVQQHAILRQHENLILREVDCHQVLHGVLEVQHGFAGLVDFQFLNVAGVGEDLECVALAERTNVKIDDSIAEFANSIVLLELLQIKLDDVSAVKGDKEGLTEMPDAGDHAVVVFELAALLFPQHHHRPIRISHRYPLALQAVQMADMLLLQTIQNCLIVFTLHPQLITLRFFCLCI